MVLTSLLLLISVLFFIYFRFCHHKSDAWEKMWKIVGLPSVRTMLLLFLNAVTQKFHFMTLSQKDHGSTAYTLPYQSLSTFFQSEWSLMVWKHIGSVDLVCNLFSKSFRFMQSPFSSLRKKPPNKPKIWNRIYFIRPLVNTLYQLASLVRLMVVSTGIQTSVKKKLRAFRKVLAVQMWNLKCINIQC